MYPNPLKQKIRDGQLVLGTSLPAHDNGITSALAPCSADFIWIDQEHSAYGPADLGMIPILLRQQAKAPVVRVPWNDPAQIKKAYDAGAVGVMVPQVDNVAAVKQAIKYAKYPPLGERGISPYWVGPAQEDYINVIKTANDETVLILQMESQEHYEQVDEILAIDGFDVLFVGPMDLSASLGVTGDVQNPKVQKIIEEMPRRAEGSGKIMGTILFSPDEVRQKIDWGYRFLIFGNPIQFGVEFVNEQFADFRKQAK
jgi:2-keto-3-deoxy-L-rhamnonate aldolase RhmA